MQVSNVSFGGTFKINATPEQVSHIKGMVKKSGAQAKVQWLKDLATITTTGSRRQDEVVLEGCKKRGLVLEPAK